MTKEELKNTKIWFGDDKDLKKRIFDCVINIINNSKEWGAMRDPINGNPNKYWVFDSSIGMYGYDGTGIDNFKSNSAKEILPSQLLGDGIIGKIILMEKSDKIPQTEVEYVECKINDKYRIKGVIYKVLTRTIEGGLDTIITNIKVCDYHPGTTLYVTYEDYNFKPSTREAYEAQLIEANQEAICSLCSDRYFNGYANSGPHNLCEGRRCKEASEDWLEEQNEEVNKCSTINQKENGNDESVKTEKNLDGNTGAEGGKDVRPRTKSLRNLCESGSIESGNQVNGTRKHRKRLVPERGETYF